jgi:hypothetical protein
MERRKEIEWLNAFREVVERGYKEIMKQKRARKKPKSRKAG